MGRSGNVSDVADKPRRKSPALPDVNDAEAVKAWVARVLRKEMLRLLEAHPTAKIHFEVSVDFGTRDCPP